MPTHRVSPGRIARSLEYRLRDAFDTVTGHRDPLVPPRRSMFVGPGDFRDIGDELLALLVREGGLRPCDRVLDIGCGIGRLARPMTAYLDPSGSYAGFDVVAEGIEFCDTRITPRFPNFRFELADVANGTYNPGGSADPADFRFPYPDESFDVAAATSLFTHLAPNAAANYLHEAARVLVPGGRLVATFFVLDPAAAAAVERGTAMHAFRHRIGDGAWVVHGDAPEEAVAYEPAWLQRRLGDAGLDHKPHLHGAWRGQGGDTHQDLVVARR